MEATLTGSPDLDTNMEHIVNLKGQTLEKKTKLHQNHVNLQSELYN